MKMSAATSYALHSLVLLARWDSRAPISATRLATDDVPKRFLPQVLHKLVEHGVLISHAGVAGGYCLARSPGDITLLEIIEAVDGKYSITLTCLPSLSKEAQRNLASKLNAASECVRARLRAIALADLVSTEPSESAELNQNEVDSCIANERVQRSRIQLGCLQQANSSP
jgi:Rrf2 family protein